MHTLAKEISSCPLLGANWLHNAVVNEEINQVYRSLGIYGFRARFLNPLLALLFEKCELATQAPDSANTNSFAVDVQTFVQVSYRHMPSN